ncbi:DUF3016 domain-containing protein [Paucibacter sp. APW11]|uniref:DUF3016 domain-containing protein n=1 Tax=Roseateles aquae TaxID=3077235 RepID=A0ABU3P9F3_9BURK|nr:DUF3016 domain-containing protein [Paucibacter sp. APW11]MDT8998917.1 DUF3016 domain-containing protein [Paucibacter sp. APW11]
MKSIKQIGRHALVLAAVLTACAVPAWAASAEVTFVAPDGYADIGRSSRDRDEALAGLKAHLEKAAESALPATQKLSIEVLQVNLAGEVEPLFRHRMEEVRVLRQVSWPSMKLHYVLRDEAGTVLKEATTELSEMDYLQRLSGRYSGALQYEKQMIDRWFASEFAADRRSSL